MTIRSSLVALLLLCSPLSSRAADRPAELARQAIKQNPSISAMEARIRALEQQVQRAGVWHDPVASVEYSNIPIDAGIPGEHPMSGVQFKLQQTFPWPGKNRTREEVARSEVKEARWQLAEQELKLATMVQRAYYSLALTRQLRRVTGDHIKLVKQFIDTVQVKYEVGKVGQHDLLRLTVLRDRLEDDLLSFQRDERALTASINAALHRATDTEVATPERTTAPAPPANVEALLRRAEKRRPRLKLLWQRAETARATARQAKRERFPDITAWAGYRIRVESSDQGTDFFALGLAVPLSFFNNDSRWGTVQRAARARARAAEAERAAELDSIRGELDGVLARWNRAAQKARTYREQLMPAAHRTLDATFAAYGVDRADFASLFQAELQLLEFERTIRRAENTAALSAVEAEALVGLPDEGRE